MSKYQSYKRTHTFEHESDVEKGKIYKEKTHVLKQQKRQKKLLKAVTRFEEVDDDDMNAYHDSLHQEKKERGNLHGHKDRLKTLTKNDDID